ncbi:MAG: helicase-related protein [Evtepia gabavorous]
MEVCLRGSEATKPPCSLEIIWEQEQVKSALVFTRTKHGADKVARDLTRRGVAAAAIHGNKSQTARQESLRKFKEGKLRVLVATDIAARGLDIEELSYVFNYNLLRGAGDLYPPHRPLFRAGSGPGHRHLLL